MAKTMDVLSTGTGTDTLIAAGEVVELRFRDNARALSLRSAKLFHLLLDHAGAKACEDIEHRMLISELNFPHIEASEIIECVRDLFGTTVELTYKSDNGQVRVSGGPLLAYVDRPREFKEGDTAEIAFRLSITLRQVLESSNHWASLSRSAVLSFESRYALRLYELMTLRGGLTHKKSEIFDLDDLRRRLGVPLGKLPRWSNFKQKVLDPAIAEVNQFSGLEVSYEAIKRGRRVDRVALSWSQGDPQGRGKAAAELSRHSAGRKARRDDDKETIVSSPPALHGKRLSFPESGTIRVGAERTVWRDIAEKHTKRLPGGHIPDLGKLADAFRVWCAKKPIPLNETHIEKVFTTWCKTYAPTS